jgi:hypothetical protein
MNFRQKHDKLQFIFRGNELQEIIAAHLLIKLFTQAEAIFWCKGIQRRVVLLKTPVFFL